MKNLKTILEGLFDNDVDSNVDNSIFAKWIDNLIKLVKTDHDRSDVDDYCIDFEKFCAKSGTKINKVTTTQLKSKYDVVSFDYSDEPYFVMWDGEQYRMIGYSNPHVYWAAHKTMTGAVLNYINKGRVYAYPKGTILNILRNYEEFEQST